ncbi:serine/threonine-protein kinase PDIK1L-like [Dendronephthya gigantea]|uniref:serine/threonine-protein kinase PDIK1L-like n=1 Tax=Dendronephthya gigantea TaxID=151771 RepID=UPI00106D3DD3|nr:serine/threonine-protein kinase PDIK1L-like [Dendronephthya gigantea]
MGQNQSSAMSAYVPVKFDWKEYQYIKTLGAGGFGEVYLVTDVKTHVKFALKKIKCGSNDDLENVMQELKSMSKLKHHNIMAMYETRCKQKDDFWAEIYMIFEYCCGGTLNDRLDKPSSKALDVKWMQQLSEAVAYIHALELVHRDLKPDNVLMDANDNVKIGDFGLSCDFVAAKRKDQSWEKYYMTTQCGTLFYMAPEVFNGHYTEKADVFALGVLMYIIVERSCAEINGMKFYGIFIRVDEFDRAPLGMQMYSDNAGLKVPFSKSSPKMAQIVGSALFFDQKKRASASTINGKLQDYAKEL